MACRADRRACIASPRIVPCREATASDRRASRSLISRGPDSAKDPGLFVFLFHFGCAPALRRRIDAWRTRRGMCAAGNPPSCSETPPPTGGLARGHSRSGSDTRRVRPVVRTPGFHSGYAGSNPARDAKYPKSLERSRFATQTGRIHWAAPEPVTGTFCCSCLVDSAARVPACPAGGRRFESGTGRHPPKSPERSRFATQTGRNDWAAPEPVTGTFYFARRSQVVEGA